MAIEREQIKPISTWEDYNTYKQLIGSIDFLISSYRKSPQKHKDMNESDSAVLNKKRELLLTIYKTLNGPEGTDVPVEFAHNRRINHVFERLFSDRKKSVQTYLKKVAKNLYQSIISDYEEKVLTRSTSSSLYEMIAAEQVARRRGLRSTQQKLHETIEDRLEGAGREEIISLAKTFKNSTMGQYDAYVQRGYFR